MSDDQIANSKSEAVPANEPEIHESTASSTADDYFTRTESRLKTASLRCCKGRVADITGSGMRILVSPKDIPEVGDVQEYTFSDQTSDVSVAGTVKWVRKGTAFTRRCEVGVEFAKLEPATRDAIIKLAVHGELGLAKDRSIQIGYPDLYKLLGVTPYANQQDIEKAYRTGAKVLHPDRSDAPDAAEKFDQFRKAYTVLSDQTIRANYDERFFKEDQQAA